MSCDQRLRNNDDEHDGAGDTTDTDGGTDDAHGADVATNNEYAYVNDDDTGDAVDTADDDTDDVADTDVSDNHQ